MIFAIRNDVDHLFPADLKKYFGKYAAEMLFFLKGCKSSLYHYDSRIDAFFIVGSTLYGRIGDYLKSLPDHFKKSQLKSMSEQYHDLPSDLVRAAIQREYTITDGTYHRNIT